MIIIMVWIIVHHNLEGHLQLLSNQCWVYQWVKKHVPDGDSIQASLLFLCCPPSFLFSFFFSTSNIVVVYVPSASLYYKLRFCNRMFIRITIVWYPIQSNPCKCWCNFKKEEEEENKASEEKK